MTKSYLKINHILTTKSCLNTRLDETKYVCLSSGTWYCIPSVDRTTVYSDLATEFMSGFPSDIPQEITHISFIPWP